MSESRESIDDGVVITKRRFRRSKGLARVSLKKSSLPR